MVTCVILEVAAASAVVVDSVRASPEIKSVDIQVKSLCEFHHWILHNLAFPK